MTTQISLNKVFATVTVVIFAVAFLASASVASAAVTGVTVTSPDGSEAWNGTQNIEWTCQDDNGGVSCATTKVNTINYSADNGSTWNPTSYSPNTLFGNQSPWAWDTTAIADSSQVLIEIVMNVGGANDTSDASFTIDNTSPQIQSVTTNDSDGNGKVDQLVVVFDESMDSSKTDTSDFIYTSSQGATPSGAAGSWTTTTNTDDTFTIPLTESAGNCNATDVSSCDTNDTSSVSYSGTTLSDLAGNAPDPYGPTAVTDGAKPAIVAASTLDLSPVGGNGRLDTISVQFSEDIHASTIAVADFTVDGYTVNTATETTGGGVPSVVDVEIDEISTPDTGVTPLVSIAGNGIEDLAGNTISAGDSGSSITPDDQAHPFVEATWYKNDTTNPTSVDRFYILFTEEVDVNDSSNIYADFSVTANDLTGFSGSPNAISLPGGGTGDKTYYYFTMPLAGSTTALTGRNTIGAWVEPTFDYNFDGTGSFTDANGLELLSLTAASMADEAMPAVVDTATLDADSDGNVDTLELKFSENVDDNTFVPADWALSSDGGTNWDTMANFSTDTSSVSGVSVNVGNDVYVRLYNLSENNVEGTATVKYKYTNGGTNTTDTVLAQNILANISATDANDMAVPTINQFVYLDQDNDGKIDAIKLVLSEDITSASEVSADDFNFVDVGHFTGAAFGSDNTNRVIPNTNSVIVPLGTEATVEDTRDDSLQLEIKTVTSPAPTFQLVDANANTNMSIGSWFNTLIVDGAAPVLLTSHSDTKTTGDGLGNTDAMVLQYTEIIHPYASTIPGDYGVSVQSSGAPITVSSVNTALNNTQVRIELDVSDANQTTAPLQVSYAQGVVKDLTNNEAVVQNNQNIADNAAPVVIGFVANPDPAKISDNLEFTLTFSEPMDTTSPLADTEFDVAGSGTPGPYAVNVDSYTGDTWTGDYAGNPIDQGDPESGTHTFSATWSSTQDIATNSTFGIKAGLDLTFVIDSAVPETTGLEVEPGTFITMIPTTVTATVSDDIEVAGAKLYIDAGASSTLLGSMTESQSLNGGKTKTYMLLLNTNPTFMGLLPTLTPGATYSLYVVGTDGAGNEEPLDKDGDGVNDIKTETLTISADTTAPTLTLDGEGTTVTVDADTYAVSGNVAPGDFTAVKVFRKETGADVEVGTFLLGPSETHWEVTVTLAQNQTSKYYAEAHDIGGNSVTSGTLEIIEQGTDTTAPVIEAASVSVTNDDVTISVTTDEVAECRYSRDADADYSVMTAFTNTNATNHTLNDNNLADGAYTYYVRCADTSGNEMTTSSVLLAYVSDDDTESPNQTVTFDNVTASGFDVVTSANEAFDRKVEVDDDSAFGSVDATIAYSGSYGAGPFTDSATGLSADTLYFVRVSVKDSAGNERIKVYTQRTAAVGDTTAPTGNVDTGDATVNADSYVISGTLVADTDAVTITVNDGSADVASTVVTPGVTTWSVTVTVPQNQTTTFAVKATDQSNNSALLANSPVVITEDSTLGVDTTAPTITPVMASGGTQTGITLTFNSDEAGDMRVYYGTTVQYGSITPWSAMTVSNGQTTDLGGLTCGTNYNYKYEARDASGNTSMTANGVFSTLACSDTTAPEFTASFANVVSAGFDVIVSAPGETFDVLVEADDNMDFSSIEETVSYTGGLTTDIITRTLSSLSSDTLYYVRVTVSDGISGAGNTRVKTYTQQTAQGGAVNLTSLSVSDVADVSATLNWDTDTTPVNGDYRVDTTPYSGTWSALTIGGTSGTQALGTPPLLANTTYYYQVRFTKNGQTTYSIPMSFTTALASTGLSVDSIQAIKSYATADDTYANGWKWKFNVTLNDLNEDKLALKFDQWISGSSTLDAANNMRYSVDDATWTDITANGMYPTTDIDVSGVDNDTSTGGRQVTVYVEMKVPAGTTGGSYSTSYGVRAQ